MKKSELKKIIREVIKEQFRGRNARMMGRGRDKFAPLEGIPIPIQQFPTPESIQKAITGMDSSEFMNWYDQTFGPWLKVTRGPSAKDMLSIIGLNEKKKLTLLDIIRIAKAIYDFLSEIHSDCCQNDSWCCI